MGVVNEKTPLDHLSQWTCISDRTIADLYRDTECECKVMIVVVWVE